MYLACLIAIGLVLLGRVIKPVEGAPNSAQPTGMVKLVFFSMALKLVLDIGQYRIMKFI